MTSRALEFDVHHLNGAVFQTVLQSVSSASYPGTQAEQYRGASNFSAVVGEW